MKFQGAAQSVEKAAISEMALKPSMAVNFFTWLDKVTKAKSDEIVNILVTAFGTGVIAPVVIAFNRFNHEDTNTKKYSALRQPISAVLAILTQVGINTPVPKTLKKCAQAGILGKHYLGPLHEISAGASASIVRDLENKNKLLKAQYEKALEDPDYREKVAKLINLIKKEDYDYDLGMAKKGRIQPPTPLKILKASEVTMEDAMQYTAKRFGHLKNLTSFLLSVLTLYPTCVLLNWLYPRIVDRLFPQLTANDKAPQKPIHTPKVAEQSATGQIVMERIQNQFNQKQLTDVNSYH